MKITKEQLRHIIRKARLAESSPADMSMHDAADHYEQERIDTSMQVPAELFNELVEYLEDMSGLKLKGSGFIASRARDLLLRMERELGIL
ncbi:MAG: hypothetical protein CMB77_04685 [Euryarchaeota archaeon]|nr:hypothetical protein [Euryarchaeota archaeon]|tara:strand:+ start:213 stop:482 length:270 start_codon:yes stop_codon:yes gene_type:complete